MTIKSAQQIIDYWYSDAVKPLWFNSTPAFDDELKIQFEPTYLVATAGELEHWKTDALGILALVILFDQIPLNIYRGTPQSFQSEAVARDMTNIAIRQGWHESLTKEQQAFLYMPFMHSESLKDQDYAVALYEQAGLEDNAKYAHHHRTIVQRFGRFPHRNKILGRTNSEAEELYLSSDEAFLG